MLDSAQEFASLSRAYEQSGGDLKDLQNTQHGLLLVSGNSLVGKNEIPGVSIEGESLTDGVKATITIKKNAQIAQPIHLCFGVLPEEGVQRIVADFVLEENASASFSAHCSFPNAVKVQHMMEGSIRIGQNARMEYIETHYHGLHGGVEVLPNMTIHVEQGGAYISTFKLVEGTAGTIDLKYDAYLDDQAVTEMYAKIYAKRRDSVNVKESIYLNGTESRGLAKSRIILSDEATADVLGEVIGNGPYSRGHVDCMEIVQGKRARAAAIPRLQVVDDTAKLTHEAAIGSVDKRQVETLMARGLSEQEATDVIVMGLLK